MAYSVSVLLKWILVCMLTVPGAEAATTELFRMESSTMDFLSSAFPVFMESVCDTGTCCETREHGHLIVKAEVIQADCPSSSTFIPFTSTEYPSTELPTVFTTTNFSRTSEVPVTTSSLGTSEVPVTTSSLGTSELPSSSVEPSSTSDAPSNSSVSSSSVRSSTTPSSPTSSTRNSSKLSTILSTNSIRPSPQPSSLFPTTRNSSFHSTFYPSSMFPSSFGPSTTPPDFSCGIGEICCETRTLGHIIVLAEVIGDQDGTSTPSYFSSTYSSTSS